LGLVWTATLPEPTQKFALRRTCLTKNAWQLMPSGIIWLSWN